MYSVINLQSNNQIKKGLYRRFFSRYLKTFSAVFFAHVFRNLKTQVFVLLFGFIICKPFFIKKKYFLSNSFNIVRCTYTFDQYCLARTHEHLHNKTVDYFFHQLVLHILCKRLCINILLMHKTYRPSRLSVLLQLKVLISQNMKIFK